MRDMNKVTNESGGGRPVQGTSAKGRKPAGQAERFERPAAPFLQKDQVVFSEEWTEADWKSLVEKTVGALQEQYPGVRFLLDNREEAGSVKDLAVSLGGGAHLVISKQFLERMWSSGEEFTKCGKVLAAAAKRLAAQKDGALSSGAYLGASSLEFWSVNGEKKKSESGGIAGLLLSLQSKERSAKRKVVVSCKFHVSENYRKVAGARTKGQVRSALSDVYKAIGDLRTAAALGEGEDRVKAKRALRSLQKLLARGQKKIKRMNSEELTAHREKKARERLEKRKAEQARAEIKKRRTERAGADYFLVKEGLADDAYVQGARQYRRAKHAYLADRVPAAILPVPPAGEAGVADMAADAGFSASDVAVTEAVTF